jgi:hypothetical protein
VPKLAVTGVTGNLGRIAAEDLLLRVAAADLIAIARRPEQAAPLTERGVEVRHGDCARSAGGGARAGRSRVGGLVGDERRRDRPAHLRLRSQVRERSVLVRNLESRPVVAMKKAPIISPTRSGSALCATCPCPGSGATRMWLSAPTRQCRPASPSRFERLAGADDRRDGVLIGRGASRLLARRKLHGVLRRGRPPTRRRACPRWRSCDERERERERAARPFIDTERLVVIWRVAARLGGTSETAVRLIRPRKGHEIGG